MTLSEIRKLPTTFVSVNTGDTHESILRAWNILTKVKELLAAKTPSTVILEIIGDLESE